MLSIRMQRRGRKGHATYRVVVQDSRVSPTSGKVVAYLGHYDPHTKTNSLVKDKAEFYLTHGAQPTERVAKLLKSEGIKLPKWVKEPTKQERATRNPEKLRKNRPEEPAEEAPAEEPEAPEAESKTEETPAEEAPKADEESSSEEPKAEQENPEEKSAE